MSSGDEYADVDGDLDMEIENYGVEQQEGNQVEENPDEAQEDNDEDKDDEDKNKKVVKPKRVIRNPQPKLNDQTLKGVKGIGALPKHFDRVQFKGKGYEEEDLNVLLKTYEYWCYRLFPKFPFESCIERLEKLGSKKPVQTLLRRLRMNLDVEDQNSEIDDEELPVQNDAFDDLVNQPSASTTVLDEETLERIRINKENAERIRQDKLRQIRERASSSLESSGMLPGNQSQVNDNQTQQGGEDVNLEEITRSDDTENDSQISQNDKNKKTAIASDSEEVGIEDMLEDINVERSEEELIVSNKGNGENASKTQDSNSETIENEDEVIITRKRNPCINSDSDVSEPENAVSKTRKSKCVVDSDSEGENLMKSIKRNVVINSDSEESQPNAKSENTQNASGDNTDEPKEDSETVFGEDDDDDLSRQC